MKKITQIGLFAGIGGFELAARWMGWETVAWVEIEPYCQQILQKQFQKTKAHDDIKTTDFTIYRGTIDLLTGGDPCQGNSVIGKMEGENYKGFLWPEQLRAISECRPVRVVNENVEGSISNGVLDRKISDLNTLGYTCWPPLVIPASFAGACHQRKRVWLVAYDAQGRLERGDSFYTPGNRQTKIGPMAALVDVQNGAVSVKPEFLRNYDGVPHRMDRIRALGNTVVPQVVFLIYKMMVLYEAAFPLMQARGAPEKSV